MAAEAPKDPWCRTSPTLAPRISRCVRSSRPKSVSTSRSSLNSLVHLQTTAGGLSTGPESVSNSCGFEWVSGPALGTDAVLQWLTVIESTFDFIFADTSLDFGSGPVARLRVCLERFVLVSNG